MKARIKFFMNHKYFVKSKKLYCKAVPSVKVYCLFEPSKGQSRSEKQGDLIIEI